MEQHRTLALIAGPRLRYLAALIYIAIGAAMALLARLP